MRTYTDVEIIEAIGSLPYSIDMVSRLSDEDYILYSAGSIIGKELHEYFKGETNTCMGTIIDVRKYFIDIYDYKLVFSEDFMPYVEMLRLL